MAASELLFPSPDTGTFQVAGRLGKPFDDVSKVMRERVRCPIQMHAHYSTISDAEKTGALARVIRLFPSPFEPATSPFAPPGVADPSPEKETARN
jgi:hypothetical protein